MLVEVHRHRAVFYVFSQGAAHVQDRLWGPLRNVAPKNRKTKSAAIVGGADDRRETRGKRAAAG